MISHGISDLNGLLQFMTKAVADLCRKMRIQTIPVTVDDGSLRKDALAGFSYKRMTILVSPRLLDSIRGQPHAARVWAVLHAIRHELRHYEQCIYLVKSGKSMEDRLFDETEAYSIGRTWADRKLSSLPKEQINPLLATRVSLFVPSGVKPKLPTSEQLSRWRYMPDPFAGITEADRLDAWRRGRII